MTRSDKRIDKPALVGHGNLMIKPLAACVRLALTGGMALITSCPVTANDQLPVPADVLATSGKASVAVDGLQMRVDQQSDRAILNWKSFNIGKDQSVRFQQPGKNSIALNRIGQQDPSRILGELKANGQVYLVNPNGFVFGKDARVDVRGLTASTLNVSDDVFEQGVTKVFSNNGSEAFKGSGEVYQKNPDGSYKLDENGQKIKTEIRIENGAQIQSQDGQNILIIAPSITNEGDIRADDRQIVLAAATDKVYLQEAGNDGLLVEVKTGGDVNNLGNIVAKRGNVNLVGFAVNQQGKISASTSLNVNGKIRLVAREGASSFQTPDGFAIQATNTLRKADNGDGLGTSATVTLKGDSVTEILPDADEQGTAIDEQAQPLSKLDIMASKVHLTDNAQIVVPGGKVDIVATENPSNPMQPAVKRNSSRILIDGQAKVDVAGVDTAVKPMESNVIPVELRLNQLKDAPLQRDGILYGKTVYVDVRKGTPLADIQPDVAGIPRTLSERLAKGGNISLQSEGDTWIQPDATLDFSGGAVRYEEGYINTTKLLSSGRVIDIGDANPLLHYDSILGRLTEKQSKWAVTKDWGESGDLSLAQKESGYIQGQDAGSLSIVSPNVLLQGNLQGGTVNGRLQRTLEQGPRGGKLSIDMRLAAESDQSVAIVPKLNTSSTKVDLQQRFPQAEDGSIQALTLDAQRLDQSGIEDFSVSTPGKVSLAAGTLLKLPDGGRLELRGGEIDIAGAIKGTSASVDLATELNAKTRGVLSGDVTLQPQVDINLQGGWVNDALAPFQNIDATPIAIDGGHFSVRANGNIVLRKGSRVNVNGGAWAKVDGSIVDGKAGSIGLFAEGENTGSNLILNGMLSAFALRHGGTLNLEANGIAIVRRRQEEEDIDEVKPLQLDNDFLNSGGFSDLHITGNINGVVVEEGVTLQLRQLNLQLEGDLASHVNADGIAAFSKRVTLPVTQRLPMSVTLESLHSINPNPDSGLLVQPKASIRADNFSRVSLISDAGLTLEGAVIAPAGEVSLTVIPPQGLPSQDPLYQPTQGIWLGDDALIDVSGVAITVENGLGLKSGTVYDGGHVNLTANRGFVATASGSEIDVSGTAEFLNIGRLDSPEGAFTATKIGSNGGALTIKTAEGAFLDGRMRGAAGDALGTSGAQFFLKLDPTLRDVPVIEGITPNFPQLPGRINVSQDNFGFWSESFLNIGDALPVDRQRQAFVSAKQFKDGGFGSVNLQADSEVRFLGDVELRLPYVLQLDAPKLGWQRLNEDDAGLVSLSAAQALIGSSYIRQPMAKPSDGEGQLEVAADFVELYGGTYTAGFQRVDLNAKSDMRFRGIRTLFTQRDYLGGFTTYGQLNLTADQVYAATLSQFNLSVQGANDGVISINGGDNHPVLSAYSQLKISAPNIEQNGILKAPFGAISLAASGTLSFGANSVTSVSGEGQTIPFGVTQGGLEWLYPIGTQNLIVKSPVKTIDLKADSILQEQGAVIDLSGGGDLQAYEFVPGIGGSSDVLASDKAFAVIPGMKGYAPYDPLETPASGLLPGEMVYLGEGSALAAGFYTLLPAHYAVLPGAYLITPQGESNQALQGNQTQTLEGSPVVSGYNTIKGTSIRDARWSSFAVEEGKIALTRSQLDLTPASVFFAEQAVKNGKAVPRLTQDAGTIVFDAKSQLSLPKVRTEAAKAGLKGLVDITADKITVSSDSTEVSEGVQINIEDLDDLAAGSLLLGGVRRIDPQTGQTQIDVKAKNITLTQDTLLQGPEIILAATSGIELQAGAQVAAEGDAIQSSVNPVLNVAGDGALLRVSNDEQAQILRTGSRGTQGDLLIRDGAKVAAAKGSVLLDSTRNLQMQGSLEVGKSLNIGAETINLGEVSDGLSGFSLDNAQLQQLNITDLQLTSRNNINLYGSLQTRESETEVQPEKAIQHLTLDAQGLVGINNAGKTAQLIAKKLTLRNSGTAKTSNATGFGRLQVEADNLELASGSLSLSGFSDIDFKVNDALLGMGSSELLAQGNLAITAAYLGGTSGSILKMNAGKYHFTLDQTADATLPSEVGIAVQLELKAHQVMIDAPLLFKGGQVSVESDGNIQLNDNAVIDVSGSIVKAGLSQSQLVSAGEINLISQQGHVIAAADSQLLLQGQQPQGDAGSLTVFAPMGQVDLNGFVAAQGGESAMGGALSIETANLAKGFSPLVDLVSEAGFSKQVAVRVKNGDLIVESNQPLTAQTISLTADRGRVEISDKLDATGDEGGSITLNAANGIQLNGGAILDASAQGQDGNGGSVLLNAVGGGISIQPGAHINASDAGGDLGSIHLRLPRLNNELGLTAIGSGTILGGSKVMVEAVSRYDTNTIDSSLIERISQETAAFMTTAQNSFAAKFGPAFELMPGVEVVSTGDLTLNSGWNLVDWRYGELDSPGYLTLRAVGNLSLRSELSDAFKDGSIQASSNLNQNVTDMLQTGRSWSYQLVAGADIHSAAIDARLNDQQSSVGDLLVGNNVKVRTGTGSIDLFAARDIVYGNDKSVVYTAGRPDETDRFGLPLTRVVSNFYVEYPLDGGDIRFDAGRHIKGAVSNQLASDWLLRTGNWSANSTHIGERPTAWGIAIGSRVGSNITPDYRQNIGALGGGNISLIAGGNVSDLSVVIPTTGKQVGQRLDPSDPTNQNYLTNEVEINGGGNLLLEAGGDLQGGLFYVDGGRADLKVDGSVTSGSFKSAAVSQMNPLLAMGDAHFDVTAGRNLALQGMIDPMILPQPANKKPDLSAIFFRYGEKSSVSLSALTGNIQLGNDVAAVIDFVNNRRATPVSFVGAARDSISVAPSSLKAYALNGNIDFKDSLILYPSSQGEFELFAAQNIIGGGLGNQVNVTMSDTQQSLLPSVNNPAANYTDASLRLVINGISSEIDKIHASTPIHDSDPLPALISTGRGDILGIDPLQFILPKPTQVMAGRDIRNVSLQFQHISNDAESQISAGRDFKFDIVRSPSTGALVNVVQRVEVSGPGRMTVLAGRHVDLGSSEGITSVGNQINSALAENGAAIDVIAGLGATRLAVDDYISHYVNDPDLVQAYSKTVTDYMRAVTVNESLSESDALAAFSQLSTLEQSHLNAQYLSKVITVFNQHIKEQGDVFSKTKARFDATNDEKSRFELKQQMDRAQMEVLAVIETLFPGTTVLAKQVGYRVDAEEGLVFEKDYDASSILATAYKADSEASGSGDISMFFSKIHSTDGGDINLFAPNGGVNAGLAVNSSGAKAASQLGVVAIKAGSVNSIVRDDFQVNTTRVMTLGGGNIVIGSTRGNIDAGRGAKTALAAPAPIVRFDNRGNLIVELPPAVAGSGIRANQASDGSQGDVLLFALQGLIDVSEAGLGGKDVTVGATSIVGSDNIDVGGVSVGVPTVAVGSIAAGLGSVSNVAASTTQSIGSSTDVAKTANDKMVNSSMGLISIDILGFGDNE